MAGKLKVDLTMKNRIVLLLVGGLLAGCGGIAKVYELNFVQVPESPRRIAFLIAN